MLIAQSMGEYGALTSLAATFSTLFYRAESTVAGFGMQEWALIGVVGLAAIILMNRRK